LSAGCTVGLKRLANCSALVTIRIQRAQLARPTYGS
jgi:hypothetical protein